MKKILIHGQSIEGTQAIKTQMDLQLTNLVSFFTSTDFEKTENIITENAIQLVVFDLGSFSKKIQAFVRNLKIWGINCSILVISDGYEWVSIEGRGKEWPHFLNTDYEPKKLVGLVKKLIQVKAVPQQVFKRYHTNQDVVVETFKTGIILDSSMYNLSKGGAYFEFEEVESGRLSVGDFVKMSVSLAGVERKHDLNAKVVWQTKKGRYSGRKGFGVRFVPADEIYRYLVESA